jgi:HK97 family phage major capsid protein
MARETFEDWIPVETGDVAIQALMQTSAVASLATPERMASDTKQIPRSGDFAIGAVAKGAAYGETSGTNDYVELIARKVGGVLRVAEEDLMDSPVEILATKREGAARNMAKFFDNATLATSGAANGTTILYTSVYKAVRTTDAATSYTADTNYVSGSATYANLSATLGKVETGDFWAEGDVSIVAHPAFRQSLRGVLDSQGRPIFFDGQGTTPDTLFGHRIKWSLGARVSGTNTNNPTGNPIMVIGNWKFAFQGLAKLAPHIANSNPGFMVQRASTGVGFLTDEALMKAAMRRAFVLGYPAAFAVFEKTS